MAGYFPAGVGQSDIDRAAGGYDPPQCECVYDPATDSMDSEDCLLHAQQPARPEPLLGNSLSPTQVRAFLDCSARWWFKYGLNLPEPKTGNLALGIAVHQAFEANFREKLETKEDLPIPGVTAIFKRAWALVCAETEFRDDENPQDIGQLGEMLVAKYMDEAAPAIEPAAVELDVEGRIGGVKIVGKVDLIDTEGRVVDVKTSARRPTGIAPDYAFQLATYRRLAPGSTGEARLSTLVKTKTIQLIQQSYRVGEADLKSTEVLYPLVQEGIRNELYFPNRQSTLCSRRNCAFWRQCEREFGGMVEES
jgi:hypothetical protein